MLPNLQNTTDIDLEDAEMQRFVEERLRAKAGAEPVRDTRSDYEKDEQALYTVPAEMRRLQTVKKTGGLYLDRGQPLHLFLTCLP